MMIPLRCNLDKEMCALCVYIYLVFYILYKWQIAKTSSSSSSSSTLSFKQQIHSLACSFVRLLAHTYWTRVTHNVWNVVVKMEILIILTIITRKMYRERKRPTTTTTAIPTECVWCVCFWYEGDLISFPFESCLRLNVIFGIFLVLMCLSLSLLLMHSSGKSILVSVI